MALRGFTYNYSKEQRSTGQTVNGGIRYGVESITYAYSKVREKYIGSNVSVVG